MKDESIYIVSDSTTQKTPLSDSTHDSNRESVITQCVFRFIRNESIYAESMILLLQSLVYDFAKQHTLQYFYQDSIQDSTQNNVQDKARDEDSQTRYFLLFIHADSQTILDFSDFLSLAFPISLNFTFQEIQILQPMQFAQNNQSQQPIIQIPNNLQIQNLINANHESYYNLSPFVSIQDSCIPLNDNIKSTQSQQKATFSSNADSMHNIISLLARQLQELNTITLQHNNLIFTLSLQNPIRNQEAHNPPCVIFADLYNAQSYLRLNDSQKFAIASFEKPFVKIYVKEAFYQEFHSDSLFVKLPSDCVLVLLFSYLQGLEKSIDYLFYTEIQDSKPLESTRYFATTQYDELKSQDSKPMLHYTDDYYAESFLHCALSASHNVFLSHLRKSTSLLDILQTNHTSQSRFVIYLSLNHDSKIFLQNPSSQDSQFQQILDIDFSCSLNKHLQTLKSYENGEKLLQNFAKENQDIIATWNLSHLELSDIGLQDDNNLHTADSMQDSCKHSKNLLDIFKLIEQLLNLKTSVLTMANHCIRDRGPRIDYKLLKHEENIILDYPRILRSVMSFHLAGVEHELLCYGVIDSLAEFLMNLIGDICLNYNIQEVFLCGDFLLEQSFLDRIIQTKPHNIKLSLPKNGSIDYL